MIPLRVLKGSLWGFMVYHYRFTVAKDNGVLYDKTPNQIQCELQEMKLQMNGIPMDSREFNTQILDHSKLNISTRNSKAFEWSILATKPENTII